MGMPADYIHLRFPLNDHQYRAALKKLQQTYNEETGSDSDELYYAGNIAGYYSPTEGQWHYSALVGKEVVLYGSYRQLFDNYHFGLLREILGDTEPIRQKLSSINLL